MKTILCVLSLLAASAGHASTQEISITTVSYPSPASIHLRGIQSELAHKAIAACGSKEAVVGLTDIAIGITEGIENIKHVATLSKDGLDLNYPKLIATAVVECK